MKQDVKVPSVGESIASGVIVTWLKQSGDRVAEGENLFELETDKAVLEIPAPAAGTLEILVDEGTEVEIGQTVAALDSVAGADAPPETPPAQAEAAPMPTTSSPQEKAQVVPAPAPVPPPPPAPAPAQQPASAAPQPATAAPTPAPPSPGPAKASGERHKERVRMSAIRRKTAERLVMAKQTAAYLTTFNDIDMEKVMGIRRQYKADFEKEHGIKIGFMSFFVKACCQALKEFPGVNAMVDGEDIIYNHFYDIGVAISIERGLVVPVIRDADKLNFAEIEGAVADLARRAQNKQLAPDELTGGTFTITNGGVFGSLMSTPIPAYPQSAILGMHAIRKRPVVVDDQIVIRPMMYAALSYDHRVIDGREAVSFLVRVKEYIEAPDKLLLEL
ncbi:MAG: dihydrolipoyllysine-residue succinyltransferase [Phycisphaerales bacterium]|nr:MAG: dihydrolipoyllysine-residue succinyltransferase [Phycisphaerales bacterium]